LRFCRRQDPHRFLSLFAPRWLSGVLRRFFSRRKREAVGGSGFCLARRDETRAGRQASCLVYVKWLCDAHPDWFREDLSKLFGMLAARQIEPVIAARMPLREAARANELLEKSQVSGKIVLLCQE